MSRQASRARTPIAEHEEFFAIELPGQKSPQERDRLSDQAITVVYERIPRRQPRWKLRALLFDRGHWTRSGIRRWWAAHEVRLLGADQLDEPIPELCRGYPAPEAGLPTIVLCHRNTPLVAAQKQITEAQSKD